MKKTDKTALTAAMFAAALNLVPMGANAYDPEQEPIQDVYGPPVIAETTYDPGEEPIQDVYGPPWMFTETTTETTTTMRFEPLYGPPDVISSALAEREKYTTPTTIATEDPVTTTKENFAAVYGPAPMPGDVYLDGKVDSFDLVRMRKLLFEENPSQIALWNADVNKDGDFNIADLVLLNRFLLGQTKVLGKEAQNEPIVTTTTTDPVAEVIRTTQTVYGPPQVVSSMLAERETSTTTTTPNFAPVYGPPSLIDLD